MSLGCLKVHLLTLCVCMLRHFSCVRWTAACQAPLSMGFSRHEYWSGWPRPPPWDLPTHGSNPCFLCLPALAGGFFTTWAPWEAILDCKGSWWESAASGAVSGGRNIIRIEFKNNNKTRLVCFVLLSCSRDFKQCNVIKVLLPAEAGATSNQCY